MKTLMITLTALTSLSAFAQPLMNSSCPDSRRIRLPNGGTGFHMSADCKTAYILPPEAGKITLQGVTGSATLQRCSELRIALRNLKQITKTLTSATSGKIEPQGTVQEYDPYGIENPELETHNSSQDLSDEALMALYVKKKEVTDIIVREFGKTPGVQANLLYSIGYGDYVQKVRELNARLAISFQQIPVKNTRFTFLSSDATDKDFPIVISSNFPAGENMNGSVNGQVVLSLLGACPLTGSSGDSLSPFVTVSKFTAALPAKLEYQYDLLSTVKYHAEVHRGGLASKIKESSSRGGFFNSKTVSKLVSKTRTENWFTYTYSCDESRVCEEAHDSNIVNIKARLMDEVLSNIALMKFEYPLTPDAAGTPGQTGAQTSSRELKKCAHIYCQIASGVLDVAQATFGSESKADKYINQENHWASEDVKTDRALPFTGTMGFAAKEF